MKSDSSKISIANIIALAGLAGIGVISFFGMLMHSADGKPGGAIIGSVALVAGLAFLLIMAIKAKGAEENAKNWRYVEWCCVAVYIIVAVLCASPFLRFFHITGQSAEMQQQARSEIEAIKALYANYDQQRTTFLSYAVEEIKNYKASGQKATEGDALAEYVEKVVVGDPDRWGAKASSLTQVPEEVIEYLGKMEEQVNSWNYFELPSLAASLETEDSLAWLRINEQIATLENEYKLIPVIEGGSGAPYTLSGYAKFDLGTAPAPLFAQNLRVADGITPLGLILLILLHLMVLLNYFVAPRSSVVPISKGKYVSGGADL
ncbi:MAG: hypothetical protein K6F94_09450 [Bacteroidaceae bacterium]|nr:hypothetical protein [Bacteroidaceae bacterium]